VLNALFNEKLLLADFIMEFIERLAFKVSDFDVSAMVSSKTTGGKSFFCHFQRVPVVLSKT